MKFFKKKNLLNVLYAILIALPIFSILGRVLYTQWNQNAKDSYYGQTINEENFENVDYDDLKPNSTYYFNNELLTQTYTQTQQSAIYYTSINWISPTISFDLNTANNFRFYVNSEGIPRIYFYNENTAFGRPFDLNTESINFSFVYSSSSNLQLNQYLLSNVNFQIKTYNKYSFLDNAFDYSISRFFSENDFGKLNFFTWFSDLFLSNNSVNNLYIHFVNWYLNYTLYVSLVYILWLVLMWFVSFIRRLLEKTSTYETGGF